MNGKQFLYIVIATFITVIAWVVFDIYHSSLQKPISSDIQQLLEPLNPTFDQEVISGL